MRFLVPAGVLIKVLISVYKTMPGCLKHGRAPREGKGRGVSCKQPRAGY